MPQVSRIAAKTPIDATAAKVTSKPGRGFVYDSKKKICQEHSETPLPMKPFVVTGRGQGSDLTGVRFGRFTVVGYSAAGGVWVVRCSCGMYSTRRGKSVQNANNADDCCEECRQVKYLRRKDEYRRHGINLNADGTPE
jgi:hypothetical protein